MSLKKPIAIKEAVLQVDSFFGVCVMEKSDSKERKKQRENKQIYVLVGKRNNNNGKRIRKRIQKSQNTAILMQTSELKSRLEMKGKLRCFK